MITVLIQLLIFAAIFAVLWWALQAMGAPQPVLIVVIAIGAIIAILLLANLLPGGGIKLGGMR